MPAADEVPLAIVSHRGAERLARGHPWVYRSDLARAPDSVARPVVVHDSRGRPLGWALWSPRSEIALRLLDRDPDARIDARWWHNRIATAVARRRALSSETTACRLVHGEGDG